MRWSLGWVGLLVCVLGVGCATYAQDLDRARRHYDANRYENALALFRVLEGDMDSFSPAEKAQYAYLRGMTDYRLAGLTQAGSGAIDPRRAFRDNARHWLAIAAAIEKETPGGMTGDEKQRLNEALTDLNRDWYGGAEALPGPSEQPAQPGEQPLPQPGVQPPPQPGMQPAQPQPTQPAVPAGPPPPPAPKP